jgi:hypothetical protein
VEGFRSASFVFVNTRSTVQFVSKEGRGVQLCQKPTQLKQVDTLIIVSLRLIYSCCMGTLHLKLSFGISVHCLLDRINICYIKDVPYCIPEA